jgi:hypothetical protein
VIKSAVEQLVSYFCIGFTVVMLNDWLLGRQPHFSLAAGVGVALVGGRVVRLLASPPSTKYGEVDR